MKGKNKLPPNIAKGELQSVEFQVSPTMVEQFIDLTGDCSSLHTNRAFARRSMYRDIVVHGMLPIVFISALKPCYSGKYVCSFHKISARFIKPTFMSDRLLISSKVLEVDKEQNQFELEYFLKNRESGAILTTGYFTLQYTDSVTAKNHEHQSNPIGSKIRMTMEPLPEEDLQFEQIQKNDERNFQFQLIERHANVLYEILTEGVLSGRVPDFPKWVTHCNTTNLLTTCLFSAFVGMCIPGKYATFMDFQATFERPVLLRKKYTLHGKVAFKSVSTLILSQDISIRESEDETKLCGTGKIKSKVNEPPVMMPSIEFLRKNETDFELKDKVVLITGASRGIGETTAKLFSLYGAKVAVNYFQGAEDADRIVGEIISDGGNAIAVQGDVSDSQQVSQMVSKICQNYGTIHVLVNNAVRDFYPISFMDLTWDELQKDINVTIKGAFNCCQAVIPLMLKNKRGKIINVSTVAAEIPPPNQAKYVVSKSALVGLTRSLAIDFAPHNIQVNMVVPSMVRTDLTSHISKMFLEGMKRDTPMKRNATPADVAKAIIFLASSLSSFSTGQKIMVTGGNPPFL